MQLGSPAEVEDLFAPYVKNIRRGAGDERQGLCPFHEDKSPSLSFNVSTGLWFCHGCGGKGTLRSFLWRVNAPKDSFPGWLRSQLPKSIIATYDYVDERGKVRFQVVRYEGKTFRQRQIGPRGTWEWNIKGIEPLPYRLPELISGVRKEKIIFIPEGEKDVGNLNAIGLVATCNPMGAGKWRASYSDYFVGASVAILPDNDEPGRRHAEQIAQSLQGKAQRIRVVALPGLPEKGDVSDWLTAGGTAANLLALIEAAPDWQASRLEIQEIDENAKDEAPETDPARPVIYVDDEDLAHLSAKAWKILTASNEPPHLFRHGTVPTRIERDDTGAAILRAVKTDGMRGILARIAKWKRHTNDGTCLVYPPIEVVRDMLAEANKALPVLTRIVQVPVYCANGSLRTSPGYSAAGQFYLAPPPDFSLPNVPNAPTAAEVDKARQTIIGDLLVDFPFVSASERAHAVALLLLPFARELVQGPTPLHLIEAPSAGTGKSLLAAVLLSTAVGPSLGTMTAGDSAGEWRKRLTAKLRGGPVAIMIDNANKLESGDLAAALTSGTWEDRILGHSTMVSYPVRSAWVATGNNPLLSGEIARRTVRIRADAKQDQPWLRKGFKHPKLMLWAKEHRPDIVWAALTLISAWIAAGRPPSSGPTLGMFEVWSQVMGGILEVAGIPGFLGNLQDFYMNSDREGDAWRGFVTAWWDQFQDERVGVAQLWKLNEGLDEPLELGKGTEKGQRTRLGMFLARRRESRVSTFTILAAGELNRAKMWRLESSAPAMAREPAEPNEPPEPRSTPRLQEIVQEADTEPKEPRYFADDVAEDPELAAKVQGHLGIKKVWA